ncbi:uncharacterized protein LOC124936680 [Impatiens glandulifera]|uniref:uncharacterized protein LOC124936680 n=1 Tax=Impatiens glandulifera TaxID=253017 RepID=UPI001FB16115|nr:uncharacterized protein LOC124936680 [Impatiens glandulifera]
MVHLINSVKTASDSDSRCRKLSPVKVEVEDTLENEYDHGRHKKRSKLSLLLPPPHTSENIGDYSGSLSEYSPLGLRLKKSPSLLDLIQMRLYQGTIPKLEPEVKQEHKITAMSFNEKLKASNFPGSLLKIGSWEYKSRYEGDLVAKCYFAKHKLVWEVLDGGLKNKIEIQWSDIMDLKANYPDDGVGTLVVVLSRQPLFFRETNPQPRKHTLWQAASDFTDGQASIQRRHFLECPQGLLGKHFEKLIQCDPRLNFISQQDEIVLESPYFEARIDDDESKETNQGFGVQSPSFFTLHNDTSPSRSHSSPSKHEDHNSLAQSLEHVHQYSPSSLSVIDTETSKDAKENRDKELKGLLNQDMFKISGLKPSISVNDLVNHLENCISTDERKSLDILKEISQCLFSESQFASSSSSVSDEQSIMKRVDSLCCLLKKDPFLPVRNENNSSTLRIEHDVSESNSESSSEDDENETTLSRKDSVEDLLLNLPRIASLPQFLFNISDDYGHR